MNTCFEECKSYGQMLVEALVAFGVALGVVTAITLSALYSLTNTQEGKSRNLATQYAQQGMEIVRRQRDSGSSFANGTYCLPISSSVIASNPDSSNTDCSVKICNTGPPDSRSGFTFIRQVCINSALSDSCGNVSGSPGKVTVAVKWSDGKCTNSNLYCESVQLISCMSNYQTVPTP